MEDFLKKGAVCPLTPSQVENLSSPQKGETTNEDEKDKVSANEGGQGGAPPPLLDEGGQGGAPPPLFLSDTELKNQGNPYAWRKGVADTTSNIFRTPRSTPDFPRIFQNVPKRVQVPTKALPFSYKAFHKTAKPAGEPEKGEPEKPTTTVPVDEEPADEEPAYAPISRPTTPS